MTAAVFRIHIKQKFAKGGHPWLIPSCPMSTDSIISKVWGFCTTLRDAA